ncbi:Hydrogenase expression/formation protein HypE [Pseudovibrio axinellae]|uniref:Hydrogenase expression/formation protein HypE n=1 Tax=Pseudovibrio axinellae TaxID=989403 RepID=A0A165W9X6_9HYPH|nr:hydrogenase expression/formation protein HypE [Pseudovibrio axinellae]KZL16265.1 Hydrogenase expression/formation protein HypE [Pseudovibrio axinellae]SER78396.1 hydrogenase expression/formation protein HypE [Pseudovibrio axinellae]
MNRADSFGGSCPVPLGDQPCIKLAHGGGGRLMQQLIEEVFIAAFDNAVLRGGHDGAILDLQNGRTVVTTDSFVVRPLFFPGGDIGTLAINGTVNDLAMCGAKPLFLTSSFILEEGLEIETLWRVVQSMRKAADAAGVLIVTGDTKVVERGHGDGIYINTTGIGCVDHSLFVSPPRIATGDTILVSGDIGRHGMAVMGTREGLAFTTQIESDCAPLWSTVEALLEAGLEIHCLRDATRGGLCSVLNELAQDASLQFDVVENDVPVMPNVRGACEVLGLDVLQVACEGRFVAILPKNESVLALEILKAQNEFAAMIGHVSSAQAGLVTLQTPIGSQRILDMPAGELLPRIC